MKINNKNNPNLLKKKLAGAVSKFVLLFAVAFTICIASPSNSAYAQPQNSYTVKSGDHLWDISQKLNTTVRAIMELNNMSDTNIYVGQVIKVPAPEGRLNIRYIDYKVRYRDTLGNLAEYFGTDVRSIRNLNGIVGDIIYPGNILKIPAEFVNYRVVPGDTLYEISIRFGTTVRKIMLFNTMSESNLSVDRVLRIPYVPQVPKVNYITHTVQKGENSWTISNKYGIPLHELLAANNLSQSSQLSIEQVIKVPVYAIPIRLTPGPQFGEYLDWYTEAEYLFPIGKQAEVIDFTTGRKFTIERTIGASHADCEPLTSNDTEIIKELWGGNYSWNTRAVLVLVDGRKMAASMSSMPHGIEYIEDNNFGGHFDIHFKNSRRHVDDAIDESHQVKVRVSAGAEM